MPKTHSANILDIEAPELSALIEDLRRFAKQLVAAHEASGLICFMQLAQSRNSLSFTPTSISCHAIRGTDWIVGSGIALRRRPRNLAVGRSKLIEARSLGVRLSYRRPHADLSGTPKSIVDIALLLLVVEISAQQAGAGADRGTQPGIAADGAQRVAAGCPHGAPAQAARRRRLGRSLPWPGR